MTLNLPGDLDMLSMIKSSPRFVDLYVPLQIDSVTVMAASANAGFGAMVMLSERWAPAGWVRGRAYRNGRPLHGRRT